MRIAIASCERPPVPDVDARRQIPQLAAAGHDAEPVAWTDAGARWGDYDLVWISSTWDYHERPEEFREWLRRTQAATRLENPAELVEWNMDKRYLRELEREGVRVVPTLWAAPDAAERVAAEATGAGWERVVVKPSVDLGAENLKVVSPDQVERAVAAIEGTSLVQPYLRSLEREGELSLVFFAGEFAYAVHKQPAAGDFRVQEHYGARHREVEADADAQALAERTLASLRSMRALERDPLFARVDLVRDDGGEPCLIALELIEPNLFLGVAGDDALAERFASLLTAEDL